MLESITKYERDGFHLTRTFQIFEDLKMFFPHLKKTKQCIRCCRGCNGPGVFVGARFETLGPPKRREPTKDQPVEVRRFA